MRYSIWPTILGLLFGAAVLFLAVVMTMAVWDTEMKRQNAPCSEFKNERVAYVPARCLKEFQP